MYKYVEKETEEFSIFTCKETESQDFTMNAAVNYFLKNYVKKHCRKSTYLNYKGIFRFDILPFFKNRYLKRIKINDIKEFYLCCINRNLSAKRVKNILALLNQLIKYFQNLGMIDRNCVFQVRRITSRTEYCLDRINFGENL